MAVRQFSTWQHNT